MMQVGATGWAAGAACVGLGDLFFSCDKTAQADAVAICGGCPVTVECLDYAVASRSYLGVWGGTTAGRREQARRTIGKPPCRLPGCDRVSRTMGLCHTHYDQEVRAARLNAGVMD